MLPSFDLQFLDHALRVAGRGLGHSWPNPSVGCIVVKNGHVLSAAHTAQGGRPHAETEALAQAGNAARGATAYVTLEPCAHHGQTPPCANALIEAGIARVVIACIDSDPRVSGQGIAALRAAGITVDVMASAAAKQLNRGFFRRLEMGIPHVAMKLATSLDGRMADTHGHSQWITGEHARMHGQHLRVGYDCILTGIGTVLADDPQLNVRAPNPAKQHLVRVVCDRKLRLPISSTLVKTARVQPTWIITHAQAVELAASHATELREAGVKFIVLEAPELPPLAILRALAAEGITRVLIEAGPEFSTAFLVAHCIETLHWYRAPILLGSTGKAAVNALDSRLDTVRRHALVSACMLGGDTYERYELN